MVSTNPASPLVIDVFRLGYYGGNGGRHVVRLGPFGGKVRRDPAVGIERLRECRWEPAAEFPIPADWPSGVYVGKLTAERGGFQSFVIFIVRDDRDRDFLFQCVDATWSAYNRWPDHWSLWIVSAEQGATVDRRLIPAFRASTSNSCFNVEPGPSATEPGCLAARYGQIDRSHLESASVESTE